jgi:hypothetical protein
MLQETGLKMYDFYFGRHADPFNLRFMLTLKLGKCEAIICLLLYGVPMVAEELCDKRGPKSTCLRRLDCEIDA